MSVLTFGVRLPNSGPFAKPQTIEQTALYCEQQGFDTVWVHDHIAWPRGRTHMAAGSIEVARGASPDFYESLTTAAVVAAKTTRVNVGVAGLVLPWRDPRVLGKQLATLDALSGGRLIVAAAIGRYADEFEQQGIPYTRRGRLTDECLAALASIFAPDPVTSFRGERIVIPAGQYFPKPERLRLWMCGSSAQALQRVARYGCGWLPGSLSPTEYRRQREALDHVLAQAHRRTEEVVGALEIYAAVAETDGAAITIAAETLVHHFGDLDRALTHTLVGSAQTVRDRVAEYAAAGVAHLELKFICHSPAMLQEMVERMAVNVAGQPVPGA